MPEDGGFSEGFQKVPHSLLGLSSLFGPFITGQTEGYGKAKELKPYMKYKSKAQESFKNELDDSGVMMEVEAVNTAWAWRHDLRH